MNGERFLGRVLVADGEYGLLERAPLDALEKRRQLAAGSQ